MVKLSRFDNPVPKSTKSFVPSKSNALVVVTNVSIVSLHPKDVSLAVTDVILPHSKLTLVYKLSVGIAAVQELFR